MTLVVYKSQIVGVDFHALVEEFRQAKLEHRFTGGFAPAAHGMVEAAVVRVPQGEGMPDDFIADYEIIDDTPPAPSAEQLKNELVAKVRAAEAAALAAVIPPGKFRLLQLDAHAAAAKRDEDRTDGDNAVLSAYGKVAALQAAIQRHGAMIEAVIDDLAPADYAAFTWPEFPK